MAFVTIFIFSFVVYGICNTIVYANGPFHIFKKMHEYLGEHHPMLNEGLSCMICSPWWVGMFLSTINLLLFPLSSLTPMNLLIPCKTYWYCIIFLDGAFASGINWFIHTIQESLEKED